VSKSLKVRYVLISDYGTIDRAGKLVLAGLYTEDLIVPDVPATVSTFVVTIVAEAPKKTLRFSVRIVSPSDIAVAGGEGELEQMPVVEGASPRAVLGFQFQQISFPEGGKYRLLFTDVSTGDETEIHSFRVVVNSEAHAQASAALATSHRPRDDSSREISNAPKPAAV
jgi:hypothetical protein